MAHCIFFIDYKGLNKILIPNQFSIPILYKLMNELHITIFILHKIELHSNYNQIILYIFEKKKQMYLFLQLIVTLYKKNKSLQAIKKI